MLGPGRESVNRARRSRLAATLLYSLTLLAFACGDRGPEIAVPGSDGALKTAASVRAERRAFDGAPPVVAHESFGMSCSECHDTHGRDVDGVGFAPPSPHESTAGMSAISRCQQCHVFQNTDSVFVANRFAGLRQDLRRGDRLNALAPPVMPHKTFMRDNCVACHSGPAAREEIRTDHPERARCQQCHVSVESSDVFPSGF